MIKGDLERKFLIDSNEWHCLMIKTSFKIFIHLFPFLAYLYCLGLADDNFFAKSQERARERPYLQ